MEAGTHLAVSGRTEVIYALLKPVFEMLTQLLEFEVFGCRWHLTK